MSTRIAETGMAVALWRRFVWTPQGAPKRKIRLDADAVMATQALLVQRLGGPAAQS